MAKPRGNRGTASLVKYTHEKDTGSSICPWGALVTLSGGAGWGWQRDGGGNTLESSALISEWRSLNSILGVWCLVTCHIVVTHHQLGFIQWLHGRPSIFYLERKQGGYDLTRQEENCVFVSVWEYACVCVTMAYIGEDALNINVFLFPYKQHLT